MCRSRSRNCVLLEGSSMTHLREPQLFSACLKRFQVAVLLCVGGIQTPRMSSI
jgi:hypothetical protein